MKLALQIAFRNISSHKRKNRIIFAVTTVLSFFMFLFLAFSDGEIENIKNGVSSFYRPHWDLRVFTKEFIRLDDRGENPWEETILNADELKKDLLAFPEIKEVISYLPANNVSLFINGKKYLYFSPIAVEKNDSFIQSKYEIVEGNTELISEKNTISLHYMMKKLIGAKIGDEISIVGDTIFDQVTMAKVRVSSFYKPYFDNPNLASSFLMPFEDLQNYVGYEQNEAPYLIIRLQPKVNPEKMQKQLISWAEDTNKELRFFTQKTSSRQDQWAMIYGMIRYIIIAMTLITFFIAAFGMMNVVSVNLLERAKEIGTYYCLGCEKPFLMAVYTIEIFLVNMIGGIAGILLGQGARLIVNALKITSEEPGFQIVVGSSVFYLGSSLSTVVWIIGGLAIITILTSLSTLGKALKVSPVVAVQELN